MKTSRIAVLISLLLFYNRGNSQEMISTELKSKFPISVINKVYEVGSRTSLSEEQKMSLALFYQRQDSLMQVLVTTNAPATSIDDLTDNLNQEFALILTPRQCNEYYNRKIHVQANKEAQINAKVLQKKYNCDSSMTRKIYDLLYRRKLAVDKAFYSQYQDIAVLDNRVYSVMLKYDSALAQLTSAASSSAYLNNRIDELNTIKPLSQTQRDSLKNIYIKLCMRREGGYVDNFNDALHRVITDTFYYSRLYEKEISKIAQGNAAIELSTLATKYKLTNEKMKVMTPILLEKAKKIAAINYTYPTYTRVKSEIVKDVYQTYDSLIEACLIKTGSNLASSQFAIAITYRQLLKLNDDQVDSLMVKAGELKK